MDHTSDGILCCHHSPLHISALSNVIQESFQVWKAFSIENVLFLSYQVSSYLGYWWRRCGSWDFPQRILIIEKCWMEIYSHDLRIHRWYPRKTWFAGCKVFSESVKPLFCHPRYLDISELRISTTSSDFSRGYGLRGYICVVVQIPNIYGYVFFKWLVFYRCLVNFFQNDLTPIFRIFLSLYI